MAADRNIPACERIPRRTRRLANLLRDYNLAIKLLGQVLQPRGDVDRIAQRREHSVTAKADIADNNHAGMDTNAVLDRLDHFRSKLVVQISDVVDDRGGIKRAIDQRNAPPPDVPMQPRFHDGIGDVAKRVIEEMRKDVGEHHQAAGEANLTYANATQQR